jgi:hypothetical protein
MDIEINSTTITIGVLILIILVLLILMFFVFKPSQCNTSGLVIASEQICNSELRFSSGTYQDKNQVVTLTITLTKDFSSDYLSDTSGGYSFVFYMIKCNDSTCGNVKYMNQSSFYLQLSEIESQDNYINMLQDVSKIYKINIVSKNDTNAVIKMDLLHSAFKIGSFDPNSFYQIAVAVMNNNNYSVSNKTNYLGGRISAFNWINDNVPVQYTVDSSLKPDIISNIASVFKILRI